MVGEVCCRYVEEYSQRHLKRSRLNMASRLIRTMRREGGWGGETEKWTKRDSEVEPARSQGIE